MTNLTRDSKKCNIFNVNLVGDSPNTIANLSLGISLHSQKINSRSHD